MTGQSLFYMGESNLKHKVLAVAEEEGAERATYALKLLQSEGELTIASTGKDPTSGRLVTHEYRVEGPVMLMLTTTAHEIDEELLNRCLVLTVNEERVQTRAIQARQRSAQTLAGLLGRRDRGHLIKLHQNAQRLLRPVLVANPFAEKLTFLDDVTRTRRDHQKYLTLIRAVALLHQHQRQVKTAEHRGERVEYIEVSAADVAVANRLSAEIFARSRDALPPQTRRLLLLIDDLVSEGCAQDKLPRDVYRFSRRAVCERTGWSLTQVRLHLERLVAHELVLAHRAERGQSFVYELCAAGPAAKPGDVGLAEVSSSTTMKSDLAGGGVVVAQAGPPGRNDSGGAPLSARWRGDGKSTLGAGAAAHHSVAMPAHVASAKTAS